MRISSRPSARSPDRLNRRSSACDPRPSWARDRQRQPTSFRRPSSSSDRRGPRKHSTGRRTKPFLTRVIDVTAVERRPTRVFGPSSVIRVPFRRAIARQHTRYGLAASLVGGSPSCTTNSGRTYAPASSTGTSPPTAPRPTPLSAASASPAITARALITPPIIAPIRSPAPRPTARASIGVGLRDPPDRQRDRGLTRGRLSGRSRTCRRG
jgi:hypothetical protein